MLHDRIYFENEPEDVYLDTYVCDAISGYTRKAILVIPGGGYHGVCSDREGEPIAMAFIPHGYNAFVLHYSVNRTKTFPAQLIQVSKAIKHIRDNAEKYDIDPNRLYTVGFSAGGHLCASIATMWDMEEIYKEIDMPFGYNKPTGVMAIYPVITGGMPYSHNGSFRNLVGHDELTEEDLQKTNICNHVRKNSVPAFIAHTVNDQAVGVQNSLDLAKAYTDAGVPYELHIYPDAPHGFALGNAITKKKTEKHDNPCIAQWISHAAAWADYLSQKPDLIPAVE
jgi:acetyl esterase/lipase